ncbi:hypothetical protein [Parasphingorhabdus sp.]|uniref:hypothetical protein n=1 Tax=Parasphingorhabdus sp. TaxID=2709688 RepID=UPI003C72F9FE
MAEDGKGIGGLIAVMTALITAGGAIAVAMINKPEPNPAPIPAPAPTPAPAIDPTTVPGPAPSPTPVASTDVTGTWSEPSGATAVFQQTGDYIELRYNLLPAFGGGFATGEGQISGQALQWTLLYPTGILQNCTVTLNQSGNRMNGQCVNNFGLSVPVVLDR